MDKMQNKICLITGSTQGIGLSIAIKLGLQGNTVIISSRKEENSYRAEEALKAKNINYDYFMCNFDMREQRKKLVKYIKDKYGKLDVLICCVSCSPYIGEALSITEREFDRIFMTNVKNTFFTVVDFLELLKKGRNPNIVLLSSHSGYLPFPFLGIFSISKSAIFMMTKVLAQELSDYNIRVNCVAPGLVQTRVSTSNIFNKYAERSFLKRMSLPHEISGVCAFLASNESSYITGEVFSVNGGMVGRL